MLRMTVRSKILSLIKSGFKKRGYDIVPIDTSSAGVNPFTMEEGLRRCAQRGIPIESVIDIGASNGSWTELCRRFFPDAHYFLVEAQPCHEPELKKFRDKVASDILRSNPGLKYESPEFKALYRQEMDRLSKEYLG